MWNINLRQVMYFILFYIEMQKLWTGSNLIAVHFYIHVVTQQRFS